MAISPISPSSIKPIDFPSTTTPGTDATKTNGANFGDQLNGALGKLQGLESKTDDLSMQMATGKLTNVHDYMIAANESQIATQMTVAVRNKAVDAFNQIMNMQM